MPIQLEDLMYPQEFKQLSVDSMSEEQKTFCLIGEQECTHLVNISLLT